MPGPLAGYRINPRTNGWGAARVAYLTSITFQYLASGAKRAPGAVADVTVIDPKAEWVIDPAKFQSKSRNTPFAGWTVRGLARAVVVGGEVKREG